MAIPHRIFTRFKKIVAHGYGAANFNSVNDWLNDHLELPRVGLRNLPVVMDWERFDVFYKGVEEQGWGLLAGADKVMSVATEITLLPPYFNNAGVTQINLTRRGCLFRDADDWDPFVGTGKFTDGVSAQYFDYPHDYKAGGNFHVSDCYFSVAALPTTQKIIHQAWDAFTATPLSLAQTSYILTRGMILGAASFVPAVAGWADGHGCFCDVQIDYVRLRYFNAVCNSLSRYVGPTAGGFELKLYGLGFWNADAEINEEGDPHAWGDKLDYVYVERLDGTVVATLSGPDWPPNEFTIESNGEVTIQSFPALPAGLYQFRLRKKTSGYDIDGYAGDWRTDAAGRMVAGERILFKVSDETPPPRKPIILTKWRWKKGDSHVFRYYAPVDTRGDLTFWEGMILGISPFSRGTSDRSGAPLFSDLDLDMDNTTQEFSRLLAEYWVKNQVVEVFMSWTDEPELVKSYLFRGIVNDYALPHTRWKVRLGSLLQKYLDVKLPKYNCTAGEYPNIHPNHINREMPEVLGRASLTEGSSPGAVEAIYVDTANFEYLGARGSLRAIPQVYADGQLVNPADYAVVYKDGGRTYIKFAGDKGDAKITFNAEGYMFADWNDPSSDGGYVRNPVYVLLFVLAFIAEVPDSEVDVDSFDALAAEFEAAGRGQSGYLVLQGGKQAPDVVQELLFSYGAKLWPARDGRATIGKKDVSEIVPVHTFFDQIDSLNEPDKPTGFDSAVNYAPVTWRHFPTANLSFGAKAAVRQSSIDAFEAEIMPQRPWAFPWTDDEELVDLRIQEELLKFGFGDLRLRFSVSLELLEAIDILETFAFQDPFALDPAGAGAAAKLYYVEKLTYDLLAGRIDVEAIDLQWILRQYFIAGDYDVLPELWGDANEVERMYAYACDFSTGTFADGEPGKIAGDYKGG